MSRADELADIAQAASGGPDFTPKDWPTDQPVPAAERICADWGRVIGPLDWPRPAPAPTAPAGLRDHEWCVPHDHVEPDPEQWQRDQDAVLAAIASPSEEPGLDVERLARAIAAVSPTGTKYPDRLAAEYARLAKEPGS